MKCERQCDELDIRDYISSCLPLSKIQILSSPCISSANWTNISLGNKILQLLQNLTELYEVNLTLLLSHCTLGFVRSHGVLTHHVTTVKTFRNGCCVNACNSIHVEIINAWCDRQNITRWRFWNTTEMSKDWSNTLDRMWRENWVASGGLREMWIEYEMLVAKGEEKLLEDSRILLLLWAQILL